MLFILLFGFFLRSLQAELRLEVLCEFVEHEASARALAVPCSAAAVYPGCGCHGDPQWDAGGGYVAKVPGKGGVIVGGKAKGPEGNISK